LESGRVSIHDDREIVPPWGINGGMFGGTSSKWLVKAGGESRERIPSKIDNLAVKSGDRIIFKTAGSGGWGDPLDRDAGKVARDVQFDLVSTEKAASDYGVVLNADKTVNLELTQARRKSMRDERGAPEPFNFGYQPPVREAAE
jgi:N-methylhydantoinase B